MTTRRLSRRQEEGDPPIDRRPSEGARSSVRGSRDSIPVVSELLARLFAVPVEARELRSPADERALLPEEARCVERAVAKRRREFAAGRLCARSAMAAFGVSNFPLLIGDDRFPVWPTEAIGSITHADDFVGAVAAARSALAGIGVDVERRGRLETGLWKQICTEAEIHWLGTLPKAERMDMATVIFSAKEAFYKCQYCVSRSWLGFHDVTLKVDAGEFSVELLKPVPELAGYASALGGRFEIDADLVATGIALPPQ